MSYESGNIYTYLQWAFGQKRKYQGDRGMCTTNTQSSSVLRLVVGPFSLVPNGCRDLFSPSAVPIVKLLKRAGSECRRPT